MTTMTEEQTRTSESDRVYKSFQIQVIVLMLIALVLVLYHGANTDSLRNPTQSEMMVSGRLSDVADKAYERYATSEHTTTSAFTAPKFGYGVERFTATWCTKLESGENSCTHLIQAQPTISVISVECMNGACQVSLPNDDLAHITPEDATTILNALLTDMWLNDDVPDVTSTEGNTLLWEGDVTPR
ncbi:hypothetical protein [Ferrimonas marina]|uniref:Uncharacterized protein n=1 Tax=Ferrimonas marina TaxID=299255 RepID=A0A1M5UFN1_9GAMM|nr:hypothetical protein [Ferrimonas marina]SHH61708.1 hypothetical protein SAMN02745129_2544 [Ferrimonas marina]